jgi:hypothetical protein
MIMNKTKLEPSKQTFTEAKAGMDQLSPCLPPSVTLPLQRTFYIPFQPSTHFVHMFKKWCENVCNILV